MLEKCLFTLHVRSADDLPLTKPPFRKPPNSFVEISLDEVSIRTKTVKRSTAPIWNEQFHLCARDRSSVLHISVKCESVIPFNDIVLGCAKLEIQDYVRGDKAEYALKLIPPRGRQDILINIGIIQEDAAIMGATAIAEARNAVALRGLSAPATVLESMVNAVGPSQLAQSLGAIMSQLSKFAKIADKASKIHPYIDLAWQVTASLYNIIEAQRTRDADIVQLVATMDDLYTFVDSVQSFPNKIKKLEDIILKILTQTVECVMFIREYTGLGFSGRVLRHSLSDRHTMIINEFLRAFVALKQDFDSGVVLHTAFISFRTNEKIDQLGDLPPPLQRDEVLTLSAVQRQFLQDLKAIELNASSRECCLPGTRIDVLDFITDWITSPSTGRNMLWLYGLAGAGKSTLTTTVANRFRELHRLGAFLFGKIDPELIIRTIAHQIALFDSRIGAAVSSAIQCEPSVCQSPLDRQFTRLLHEPIRATGALASEGPIVIVVDGLDEYGTAKSRKNLLAVLTEQLPHLPSFIRVLVTSRAEFDIKRAFESHSHIHCRELDITSAANESDIRAYIGHEMESIRKENDDLDLPSEWPDEETVRALVKRSGGLFVWASTAIGFIQDGHDPNDRLKILLRREVRAKAESALDDLYITALQSAGKWNDEEFCSDFRAILGTILTAFESLSLESVDHLSGLKRPALHTISRLRCVLRWSEDGYVQIIHPSFSDFLLDKSRCQSDAWFIDARFYKCRIIIRCFEILMHTLSNPSLIPPADSVYWIHGKVPKYISYSAQWWSEHLLDVDEINSQVVDLLDSFLGNGRLLQWFGNEVMNSGVLKRLKPWIDKFAPVLRSKGEIVEILRGILDAELRMNMAPLDCILRDIERHGCTGSTPYDMQQWVEEARKEMMAEYNGLLYGGDAGVAPLPIRHIRHLRRQWELE